MHSILLNSFIFAMTDDDLHQRQTMHLTLSQHCKEEFSLNSKESNPVPVAANFVHYCVYISLILDKI